MNLNYWLGILLVGSTLMFADTYSPYVATSVITNPKSVSASTAFYCDFLVTDVDTYENQTTVNHSDQIATRAGTCNSGTSGTWEMIETGPTFKYRWHRTSKATAGTYTDYYEFRDTTGYGNFNDTGGNWVSIGGDVVIAGAGGGGGGG